MGVIISRFAPAPTGFLHLGHVLSAAFVWGVTRALGGKVLLRIEDHDRQRSRPEFESEILNDLQWLGFTWDGPVVRQSARGDIYSQKADELRARGLVYVCSCSRTQIESAEPGDKSGVARRFQPSEVHYPGICRDRGLADRPGVGLRVRLDPSVERFDDLLLGPQEQHPWEQCGDMLIRDREGNWTYQFAATVDDYLQGVTLVIRGQDLLPSTGRQLQLARLLGRADRPRFLHHPLVMRGPSRGRTPKHTSQSQKLSKSDGDTGISLLRARGWTPARLIGESLARAGILPPGQELDADAVSSIMSRFREVRLWPE